MQPPSRSGSLVINEHSVSAFQEKPLGDGGWINDGFFVLTKEIFSFINCIACIFKTATLPQLSARNELSAYRHTDFREYLEHRHDKQKLTNL